MFLISQSIRGVAKPGIAPRSGRGDRRFKSSRPDLTEFSTQTVGNSVSHSIKFYKENIILQVLLLLCKKDYNKH